MLERKPIATIETENGTATIIYNGAGETLTAEMTDGTTDTLEYIPVSLDDAIDAVYMMYSSGPWYLEWIEQ